MTKSESAIVISVRLVLLVSYSFIVYFRSLFTGHDNVGYLREGEKVVEDCRALKSWTVFLGCKLNLVAPPAERVVKIIPSMVPYLAYTGCGNKKPTAQSAYCRSGSELSYQIFGPCFFKQFTVSSISFTLFASVLLV